MTAWGLRNPPLTIGVVLVLAVVLVATFHPLLSSYAVEQMDMRNRLSGPTLQHWLGTDNFGRELWTCLCHGSAISLALALGSVAAGLTYGFCVWLLRGY